MTPSGLTGYTDRKRLPLEARELPLEAEESVRDLKKQRGTGIDLSSTAVFDWAASSGGAPFPELTFEGSIKPAADSEKITAIEGNPLFSSAQSSSSSYPLQSLSRAASSVSIDYEALRKTALEKAIETLRSGIPVSFETVESISRDCFTKANGFSRSISKRTGFNQFNRWHIARPWDHNLCGGQKGDEEHHISYINASRVTLGEQTFFASDAPKPLAFERFWNFIWKEGIQVIVNLTEMYEKGEKLADSYWIESRDKENTKVFGSRFNTNPIRLKLDSETFLSPPTEAAEIESGSFDQLSYDLKKIQYVVQRIYTLEKEGVAKKVIHFHYRFWPDHGAPAAPEERATFLALVDHIASISKTDPIFVHCSAGLGRTGALLAAFHARQQQLAGMIVDRPELIAGEIVLQMRAQRMGLIQSPAQFQFVTDMMRQSTSV